MSFGAFGGRASVMAMFDPRSATAVPHAGTFNNNVLTMSAGIAALGEVYTPAVARALNDRGDALRASLNDIAARRGLALHWTGRGSMLCFHVASAPPRNAGEAAAGNQGLKELLFLDLLDRGFYIARRGMIAMSLAVGEAELAAFEEAVAEVLDLRAPLFAA
jgi:glutamate-1-semialdehyde 2,1-aminomutase